MVYRPETNIPGKHSTKVKFPQNSVFAKMQSKISVLSMTSLKHLFATHLQIPNYST